MSINRKNPLHFDLRYGSQRHQLALAPFSGLDLNENPLTANKGSCSDMLNMVVDDNAFLTLRPRLVDDPEYLKAKQSVEEDLTGDYVIFQQVLGQRYIKDGYLFLVGEIAKQEIAVLTITDSLTLPNNSGVGFNITVKIGGFSYNVALNDNYTYPKPLLTSIIWAQIGGYPDLPFSMAMTSKTSTITFTFIEKDGQLPEYNVSPTVPLGIEIPHTFSILQYGVSGTNKALVFNHKGIKHWILYYYFNDLKYLDSFDDFLIYPEKDYYRFIQKSDGKNFILKLKDDQWEFKELEPYIPTYKAGIKAIETLDLAPIYEDLNILTNKYKITVGYDVANPINLGFFERNAIKVEGDILKTKEHDIPEAATIIHQDEGGFIYYMQADYDATITSNSDYTYIPFFYYSYTSKESETLFTLQVYKDADPGYPNRLTKDDLQRLYVSDTPRDGNGKKIPRLYYDATSHSLLRYRLIYPSPAYKGVWGFYQYSIDDEKFYKKVIFFFESAYQGANVDSFYYINGEIALLFDIKDKPDNHLIGRAMIVYNALGDMCYSLFGHITGSSEEGYDYKIVGSDTSAYLNPNALVLKPLFYFEADGKKRLISNGSLAFLIDQRLANDNDSLLTPNNPADYENDELGLYLYYDVTGELEPKNFYDFTKRFSQIEATSMYKVEITGRYTLIYSLFYEHVFLIDTEYPDQSVRFNISNLITDQNIRSIEGFSPSPWGNIYGYILTKDGDPAFLIINKDATSRHSFTQYDYSVIKDVPSSPLDPIDYYFITEGIIFRSQDGGIIYKTTISNGVFEYTYDLTNEDNPLIIKKETIDGFRERQEAFKFTSEVSGRTLITDALLYYNDKYTFVTDPDFQNYNYIPAIHCQKSLNPIRFASSYLQELGIIYQQNSVTYLGWNENPFKNTTFLHHERVLQYDHLEQRAIDYLPNGHLVTFAGLTIYLNKSGVYALNFEPETPQDTERRATLISGAINSKLLKEDLSTAILANFTPYILILFPKNGYTSVYALKIMVGQWYYWELPFKVKQVLDDNVSLRLINGDRFVRLNEDVELVDVFDDNRVVLGSVEKYLDFGTKPIKWYWKSQPIHLGTITARKQITQTHFVFLNPNASFDFDRDTFDLTHSQITSQRFGVRFYAFQEHVTERPSIDYEAELQIINNIQRRTYINRFKYCQLLCYNIDDDGATSDKVRLGDIIFTYKVLSGGK